MSGDDVEWKFLCAIVRSGSSAIRDPTTGVYDIGGHNWAVVPCGDDWLLVEDDQQPKLLNSIDGHNSFKLDYGGYCTLLVLQRIRRT